MPYTATQLTQYYTSVNGVGPDQATQTLIQVYANQNATGTRSDASTLALVLNGPQTVATTDVAVATYQFFTGSAPSAAGLAYLRGDANSTTPNSGNPNGLNTAYYNGTGNTQAGNTSTATGGFDTENRYFNFALSLASGNAAANANFKASYGGTGDGGNVSFNQAVAIAYEAIIGTPNVGAANAAAAIASIQSSFGFFQQVAQQRGPATTTLSLDLATKAVAIGYILEEAVKADVGTYAKAIDQFNASTAAGNNTLDANPAGVNILTAFQAGGAGFNTGVGFSGAGTVTLGTPVTLTTGGDSIVQVGPLAISGSVDVPAAGTANTTTLNASDSVAPTGSNNTLSVVYSNTGTAAGTSFAIADATNGAAISNVQTFNIRNVQAVQLPGAAGGAAGANSTVTLNAGLITGVTTVNDNLSVGNVVITNAPSAGIIGNGTLTEGALAVGFTGAGTLNLQNGTKQTAGVASNTFTAGAAGAAANTATPTGITVTSAPTTFTINSIGAANQTAGIALSTGVTVTALTINANANLTVSDGSTNAAPGTGAISGFAPASTINITGGATSVNVGTVAAAVTTINASGLTAGGAAVRLIAGGTTFTGGTGNDTVTISAGVTETGTVNGGAGTNTLNLQDNANLTAAQGAKFTNFQTLGISNNTGGAVTFDPTQIAGVTSFNVGASSAASPVTLTNLAASPTVNVTGNVAGGLTLLLKDASGLTDSATLTLTGGVAVSSLTTGGVIAGTVETLNVVSSGALAAGSAANSLTLAASGAGAAFADANNVKITGATALALTTGLDQHSVSIDGSTATGSLYINASATTGTAGAPAGTTGVVVNINGGTANDTLIAGQGFAAAGSFGNQTIFGGGGGDLIVLGSVNGGGAATTIAPTTGVVTNGVATHTQIDTLVFKAATDSLLDVTGISGAAGAPATTGAAGTSASTANTGTLDNIYGFVTNQDKIDVFTTGLGFTSAQLATVVDKTALQATTATLASVAATAGFFNTTAGVTQGAAEVHVTNAGGGTDTYVFFDTNHDGVFTQSADMVIRLVGTAAISGNDLTH